MELPTEILVERPSDSPTPTPLNTAAHTPAPSTRPSPRPSGEMSPHIHHVGTAHVHGVSGYSRAAKYQDLALYFMLNLSLTMFNKALMAKFPFPYLLTSLHAGFGTLGCHFLLRRGYFSLSRLTSKQKNVLIAFSFLYTINISLSNISLHLVTIPFHQVVRATSPVFTVLISIFKYGEAYSTAVYLSLIPVIVGVGFATYGDYYCTPLGFLLTLLGALSAAVKTVVTNRIQTGSRRLSALEILYRMGPLAFGQGIFYAYTSGELAGFRRELLKGNLTMSASLLLFANGLVALGLNVMSFTANKKTGPLTMTVAANVKQILTIILSTVIFKLHVGAWNAFGIALTLAGGIWYAKVGLEGKKMHERRNTLPLSKRLEDIDRENSGQLGFLSSGRGRASSSRDT